jgi:hypothetical protein
MNKSERALVRTVAFLVFAAASASMFGLLSSWMWGELDPTQQAAIATINAPLMPGRSDRESVANASVAVRAGGTSDYRAAPTPVTHTH